MHWHLRLELLLLLLLRGGAGGRSLILRRPDRSTVPEVAVAADSGGCCVRGGAFGAKT